MKHKPLPAEVFIYRENEGEGEEEFLSVNDTLGETVEHGTVRRVGRYVLSETVDVSTTMITTVVKVPKEK